MHALSEPVADESQNVEENLFNVSGEVQNEQMNLCPTRTNGASNATPVDRYYRFHSEFQKSLLLFTMKIREEHLLPQSTAGSIVDGMQGLFEMYALNVNDIIKEQLKIDPSPENLDFILDDESFFSSMCPMMKNESGLTTSMSLHLPYVKPLELCLGTSDTGKQDVIHIVPLADMLRSILSHDDIVDEILAYNAQRARCDVQHMFYDIIMSE